MNIDISTKKKISNVLLSLVEPSEAEKVPYMMVEKKYQLKFTFFPLIQLQGLSGKEFKQQFPANLSDYTSLIFTSKNAIEHYFRIIDELGLVASKELRCYCSSEAIALHLQKFILYKKRKVFSSENGTNQSLFKFIMKQEAKLPGKYLYICNENQKEDEIVSLLRKNKLDFQIGQMYRTTINDQAKHILTNHNFDMICVYTPMGIQSLYHHVPDFPSRNIFLGAFGSAAVKYGVDNGIHLDFKAPNPQAPSMLSAIEIFIKQL
ncbi:MAG: uroporphyrinogen-III synthase [Phycisphaerales bacterium]|nr:uroporphyrinogen-III synthase [Phycisphaerales bacterium]